MDKVLRFILFVVLWIIGLDVSAALKQQQLSYSDALLSLNNNTGRGFYRTCALHLKPAENKPANTWGDLVHLRVDISEFSENAVLSVEGPDTLWGVSQPLTQDALDALDQTFAGIRKRGKMVVVRVCYDPWYNGKTNTEPGDQRLILSHLRQLAPVYNKNADVILAIELGMYGPWGEMHSSQIGTNANIAGALQTLLAYTSPEIKVLVRRPDIIATWLGLSKKEFVVETPLFKAAAAAKGDTMFRAGMFNDGYLGSSSDLGTVDGSLTREMMVNWLQNYSKNTPYGGELVANYNGDHPINTPSYLSFEGFKTHTSYLNYEWHQPTILAMKDSVMTGVDAEYEGVSGYKYLEDHLGYRFVLRNSLMSDTVYDRKLDMEITIQNVGFAGMSGNRKASLILVGATDTVEVPLPSIQVGTFFSRDGESDGYSTSSLSLDLPQQLPNGNFKVYFRISRNADFRSDGNYQCVQFANSAEQFDAVLGANLLGDFVLNTAVASVPDNNVSVASCWQCGSKLYTKGVKRLRVWDVQGRLLFDRQLSDGETVEVGNRRVVFKVVAVN